jgi:hypothetical protein
MNSASVEAKNSMPFTTSPVVPIRRNGANFENRSEFGSEFDEAKRWVSIAPTL